jgi:hypothetical protein
MIGWISREIWGTVEIIGGSIEKWVAKYRDRYNK